MQVQDSQSGSFLGGFSLSNLGGVGGKAALLVTAWFAFLGGIWWIFRDVAQF